MAGVGRKERESHMKLNRNDTRTPDHYRERARRLRDQANSELDEKRREQLRRLAQDQENLARDAERLKG
jgi:hypothetical protein